MTEGLFITGTNTGVGKTWVGCALAEALRRRGMRLQVRKPVESGCPETGDGLLPQDALALRNAAAAPESLQQICPYRFRTPVSPARAAELERRPLTLAALADACRPLPGHWRLVEGAGGFYSPLAADGVNADLAEALKLPLLVVAPDRLGVLSAILLTLEAAERRGLTTAAVFLNRITPPPKEVDNAAELRRWTGVPVVQDVEALIALLSG